MGSRIDESLRQLREMTSDDATMTCWKLLERIQLATLLIQLVMVFWISTDEDGQRDP